MGTLGILGSTGRNFLKLMGTDAHVVRVLELNFLGVELAWMCGESQGGDLAAHTYLLSGR